MPGSDPASRRRKEKAKALDSRVRGDDGLGRVGRRRDMRE